MGHAKRSLSQNFLVDPNIRRKLVSELEADCDDAVLEVGPGHGELTDLLAGRVRSLVVVEKDDRLAADLGTRFAGRADVSVIHGDALDLDLAAIPGYDGRRRLISNVPYSITSPLIFRFLDIRPAPVRMLLLVQREVAERIVASPCSRTYGALTVGVQTRASARIAFTVGRMAFRPVPGVESAAVVVEPTGELGPQVEEDLRTLTRIAFSMRRKQLGTILRSSPHYGLGRDLAEQVLSDVGVSPTARPETMAPGAFLELSRRLRTLIGKTE